MAIDAWARVHEKARIGDGTTIGPFAVVGPDVTVGEDCEIANGVVLSGHTTIGRENRIHPHAVIGGPPQDLKHKGEPTRLEVGDRNEIREGVTLNVGTVGGGGVTRVGSDALVMAYAHVAHDCRVGDGVILLGTQGGEKIGLREIAEWVGTIPYEILCGVSKRIPRIYKD